jgi:hypothetical protein
MVNELTEALRAEPTGNKPRIVGGLEEPDHETCLPALPDLCTWAQKPLCVRGGGGHRTQDTGHRAVVVVQMRVSSLRMLS